jgi:hypothetical protein
MHSRNRSYREMAEGKPPQAKILTLGTSPVVAHDPVAVARAQQDPLKRHSFLAQPPGGPRGVDPFAGQRPVK